MQITDPIIASRTMLHDVEELVERASSELCLQPYLGSMHAETAGNYIDRCCELLRIAQQADTPYLQLNIARDIAIQVAKLAMVYLNDRNPDMDLLETEINKDILVIQDAEESADWDFIYDQKMFTFYFMTRDSATWILDHVIETYE